MAYQTDTLEAVRARQRAKLDPKNCLVCGVALTTRNAGCLSEKHQEKASMFNVLALGKRSWEER